MTWFPNLEILAFSVSVKVRFKWSILSMLEGCIEDQIDVNFNRVHKRCFEAAQGACRCRNNHVRHEWLSVLTYCLCTRKFPARLWCDDHVTPQHLISERSTDLDPTWACFGGFVVCSAVRWWPLLLLNICANASFCSTRGPEVVKRGSQTSEKKKAPWLPVTSKHLFQNATLFNLCKFKKFDIYIPRIQLNTWCL